MPATKTLITAIILSFILANVATAATRPSSAFDSDIVVVEVAGSVPGFTQAQLAAYLARRMHDEIAVSWQFAAAKPGVAPAPNRVIWSFKTLRTVWRGGSHRGFASSENSATYLSAEVKLFLNDTYQMTMIIHPSVSGGYDEKALSEMAHDVAHTLFVENRPATP
jgi:hypothetical protein